MMLLLLILSFSNQLLKSRVQAYVQFGWHKPRIGPLLHWVMYLHVCERSKGQVSRVEEAVQVSQCTMQIKNYVQKRCNTKQHAHEVKKGNYEVISPTLTRICDSNYWFFLLNISEYIFGFSFVVWCCSFLNSLLFTSKSRPYQSFVSSTLIQQQYLCQWPTSSTRSTCTWFIYKNFMHCRHSFQSNLYTSFMVVPREYTRAQLRLLNILIKVEHCHWRRYSMLHH